MTTSDNLPDATTGNLRPGRTAAGCDLQKRDQILSGAHRIFSRMEYDAASMNDITCEARVSKGMIYVYFSSKEDLFEALIEGERQVLFAGIGSALDVQGTLEEKLYSFATALIRVLCSDQVIMANRIVIGVCKRMPEPGLRFIEGGALRTTVLLSAFLQAEVARGTLAIPDPNLAAAQFVDSPPLACFAGGCLAI